MNVLDHSETKQYLMDDHSSAKNSTPTPCTVCQMPSRGMCYGAIACEACKLFFRRNGPRGLHLFQCHFDGHCEINIHTRHLCVYCRLAKCFGKGMQTELIRCVRSTTKKSSKKKTAPEDEIQIVSIIPRQTTNSLQIRTINLLQSDQSTLTVDQWNLLSNLSHCFDEHTPLSLGEQYMSKQSALPVRFRYGTRSVIELYRMFIDGVQSLYNKNQDLFSLCSDDLSIILHYTIPLVAGVTTNLIGYKIHLMNYPAYFDAIAAMSTAEITSTARRLSFRLDFDLIVIKLLLAIFSLSTYRCIGFSPDSLQNFTNIQHILHIQDAYIEVTWRYLLYKYDDQQAVKCFSDFIRCVFVMNGALLLSQEIKWFNDRVDSLTKKTEESFSLHD